MKENEIENDYARFYIKDGILFFVYKEIDNLDLDAAKKIVADRLALQDSVSFPVLCDIRGLKGADKTARDYLAREGSALTECVGLLVDSPALKLMTNFYLMVNKPQVPTKVFRTKEEAIGYIRDFMN
ncbi:MAG: hypothetical protein AAFQ94_21520 [Bacteroidota bacterium]